MSDSLKERLKAVFKQHVEKDYGLIAGPDRLLNNVIAAVEKWLKEEESDWRETECEDVVEALRDLRVNQLR